MRSGLLPIASEVGIMPRMIGRQIRNIASSLVALFFVCACVSQEFRAYVGRQQKWPTATGAFVDSEYAIPVYYGYPQKAYTVLGFLEETSYGRPSDAVEDAANRAKELWADAVILESPGKRSEAVEAFTNGSIMPISPGTTIIAPHRLDRATVVLIRWL